jgi:hypothetical protein
MSNIDIIVILISLTVFAILTLINIQILNDSNMYNRNEKKSTFKDEHMTTNLTNENPYGVNDSEKISSVASQNIVDNTSIKSTNPDNVKYQSVEDSIAYGCVNSNNNLDKKIVNEDKNLCKNESINNQRNESYKYYSLNTVGNDITFPICDYTNKVSDVEYMKYNMGDNNISQNDNKGIEIIEGNTIDQKQKITPQICIPDNMNGDYDISECYRKNLIFQKSHLEDPFVRGNNLNSFDNYSMLDQVGKINLKNDYMNPKPSGYVFEFSPVYNR